MHDCSRLEGIENWPCIQGKDDSDEDDSDFSLDEESSEDEAEEGGSVKSSAVGHMKPKKVKIKFFSNDYFPGCPMMAEWYSKQAPKIPSPSYFLTRPVAVRAPKQVA